MQHMEMKADKKHLVDASRIARAVDFLSSKGVELERIHIELSRTFYVDLDELNAVLDARRSDRNGSGERRAA